MVVFISTGCVITLSFLLPKCSCFISNTGVFFGALLGPILLVIVLNTFLFIPVIYVVIKHAINRQKQLNVNKLLISPKEACKTVAVLFGFMVLLGLTWILSLLTAVGTSSDVNAAFAFHLLFNIFNSTQGFYIFICFVVLSSDARQYWKNTICRCQRTKPMKQFTHSSKTASSSKKQTKINDEVFTAELFTLDNSGSKDLTEEFNGGETESLNEYLDEAEDHDALSDMKETRPHHEKRKSRDGPIIQLRRMSSTSSYSKM